MLMRVLLVCDVTALRRKLEKALTQRDVLIEFVRKEEGLWERISRESSDLVVVTESLIPEPKTDSIAMLSELPDTPWVVALVQKEDAEQRAALLSAGCEAVLNPGLPMRQLRDVFDTLLDKRRALSPSVVSERFQPARATLDDFVSESPQMRAFMKTVTRVAASGTSLLITGETGVGKERLARAIHAEGKRGDGPFVAVNCGALPDALLESELFGHEEGAFTGATRSRRGAFEMAHRGTIFLDEIAEMPFHLQVKLLRVLQEREIQRVGGEKPIVIDVRIMAASNRDLDEAIREKRFRQDLYHRLSVVVLTIPPLRERVEDIPALVSSYIEHFRVRIPTSVKGISDAAMAALKRYAWPGNVRELINVIERAVLLAETESILCEDLPPAIGGIIATPLLKVGSSAGAFPDDWLSRPLGEIRRAAIDQVERTYLTRLLEETGGRVGLTAERAGIESRSLYDKMKRFGLHKEDFKLSKGKKHDK